MRLETEFLLLGWGLVGAVVVNALFSERKRPEDRQPVDFWRAMEVLGLWAAAGVGLAAIYFSTRDAGEQVGTMREQLRTMSGQLAEMQQEGRAWLGPVSGNIANNISSEEPLKVSLAYRNFGKQPAALVRNRTGAALLTIKPGEEIEQLPGWKDTTLFNPRSLCETKSPTTTLYPSDKDASIVGGLIKQNPFKDESGNPATGAWMINKIVGRRALYIFNGCFTYVSAGKREYTTFCIMVDPRTSNDNPNLSTWQLVFCPYGNDNGELAEDDVKGQNGATGRE